MLHRRTILAGNAAGSFRFFETYSIVTYIYLLLTIGLSLGLRGIESRMRRRTEK